MSNVVQLFPRGRKEEPTRMVPRIRGLEDQILSLTDWAESEGVDVYSAEYMYFMADVMQRLQMMAHLGKRRAA